MSVVVTALGSKRPRAEIRVMAQESRMRSLVGLYIARSMYGLIVEVCKRGTVKSRVKGMRYTNVRNE